MRLIDRIRGLHPCHDAVAWLGDRDPATAWAECRRGDWLLWLAARAGVDRRLVVLAACDCVEPALVHVPAGELRPAEAIRVARAWARGEATLEEVERAAAAAYSATYDAYAAFAAYYAAFAAYAVSASAASASAASAASSSAFASASASDSASAAADAASYAASSAGIVRAWISWKVVDAALAAQEAA
jgi:hypothetical protein